MTREEMNAIFRESNFKQMHINAIHNPACFGKLRKFADGSGNFDIYYDPSMNCFMSIAKPGSGCTNSYFGDKMHIIRCLRNGWIDRHMITKYGRRILKVAH